MRWKILLCLSATLTAACAGLIATDEDAAVETDEDDKIHVDNESNPIAGINEPNSDTIEVVEEPINDSKTAIKEYYAIKEYGENEVDSGPITDISATENVDEIEVHTEQDIQEKEQTSNNSTDALFKNNTSVYKYPENYLEDDGETNNEGKENFVTGDKYNIATTEVRKETTTKYSREPSIGSGGSISMIEEISKEDTSDVIQTENGPVKGIKIHGSHDIFSYLDIPYGKIEGYFQAPAKPDPWDHIHDITEHQKRCPQVLESGVFAGEPDCLTLSVFAPSEAKDAAVLFHIHEGNFLAGSGDPAVYGPEHLVSKGIILVLPNYRLSVMGFLCLRDEMAPGNAALKDLTLALEWVNNNIQKFGGDPTKIVVSGDGTSGALAGYLALSSQSREFIDGIITESGSVLAPWAIDRDPEATANKLVVILREDISTEIDLNILITSAKDIKFKPCIENGTNPFLDTAAWNVLNSGDIEMNFMIGSANHAGLLEAMMNPDETISNLNKDVSIILPDDLRFDNDSERDDTVMKIKQLYFNNDEIHLDDLHNISLLYTDAYYLGPAIRTSKALVDSGNNVYFYEFGFVGELNREPAAMATELGATRGDLAGYVFTQDGNLPLAGSEDEKMVALVTDLWASFIQTGEPKANQLIWNQLQVGEEAVEEWLWLSTPAAPRRGLHPARLALWTNLYSQHYIDNSAPRGVSSAYGICCVALLLMFNIE